MGDRLVLLRLARAGRVNQPAAGRDGAAAACCSMTSCAAASDGRSSSRRRQRMSGSRRRMPRPEHGASTSTQSNGCEKGSGCSRSACTSRTFVGAARFDGPAQQIHPPSAHVAGDEQPACFHRRRHRQRRLSAGRRAGVEHARARMPAGEQRDELRRFVLHRHQTVHAAGQPALLAGINDQAVGRKCRGCDDDVVVRELFGERFARDAQPVGAQRQRRGRVVEAQPLLGRVEAEAIVPAFDEPARMRERHGEIVDRRRPIGRVGRARRQRQRARAREIDRSTALTSPLALRLPARPARFTASSTTAAAGTRVR